MAKWMIANKKADFDGLAREFSIKNITARLIANRCGVFTGVIPSATSLPHPPLPASVFGELPFLGGGLGAS